MKPAPTDPVRLRVTALSDRALEYLRFMTGRELRARVTRGGGPEDVLHIRIGGHALKARLTGTPLPGGRDFFVRVERQGGNFRLVVLSGLDGPGAGRPAGSSAGAGPGLIPGLSAGMYREYLAFLEGGGGARRAEPDARGRESFREFARLSAEAQKEFAKSLLARLPAGPTETGTAPGAIPTLGGEPIEFVLYEEWQEHRANQGDGDAESGQGEALGFGRGEPGPASFWIRLRLPRLGTIGILIQSADGAFRNPSVTLSPLEAAAARLLERELPAWRDLLVREVPGLEGLTLIRPLRPDPVDFSA